MSVDKFIPQIWAASILRNLEKASVWASLLNRDYTGDATYGNVVKIPTVDPVSVRTYEKGVPISYDNVSGSVQDLVIDQQKYFAVRSEDVEVVQARPAFLTAATANASYSLRDEIDMYCAKVLADGAEIVIGSEIEPVIVNQQNFTVFLAQLSQRLTENNVPLQGRWCVLSPYLYSILQLVGLNIATNNSEILSEGYIGRALGFDILVSPNTPTVDGATVVLAGTSAAGSLIQQINSVETLRDINQFGDVIRGLAVYGAACTQSQAIVAAFTTKEMKD
jgi:hypothetical protein